jgi:hypothetical protein
MKLETVIIPALLLAACGGGGDDDDDTAGSDADTDTDTDTDIDTDTDTDTDADADADGDSDADSDADADSDSDSGTEGPAPGDLLWAVRFGGTTGEIAGGVAVAPDGSAFAVGSFEGTAVFGAGDPGETALASAGGTDVFVARWGADGHLAWAVRAGGTGDDAAAEVRVLGDGSVFVAGTFSGTAVFGPGEDNQTTLQDGALFGLGSDPFLARYGADGALLWARSARGGFWGDDARRLAVLPGNVAVTTGRFGSGIVFGEGEPNETVFSDATGDRYLAAHDADGALVWAVALGGEASYFDVTGLAGAGDGSVRLIGEFSGTAAFDSGGAFEILMSSTGGMDVFLASYDGDGRPLFATRAGGSTFEAQAYARGGSVAADGSAVVTGAWKPPDITFGAGEDGETTLSDGGWASGDAHVFVARYDGSGQLVWARSAEGNGGFNIARGAALGSDGSVRVAGSTQNQLWFTQFGEVALESGTSSDAFLAAYAADGTPAWAVGAGSDHWARPAEAVALAVLPAGSAWVLGSFAAEATFGAGGEGETTLLSAGATDLFLARYAD